MFGSVGRPSLMSAIGREALPDVREWSRRPTQYPEEVGRPSWMSASGQEALLDVQSGR